MDGARCLQTRNVSDFFSIGHAFQLSLLDREVIDRVVPGLVTPVSTETLSLLSLFVFSEARVVILPCDTTAEEVPIHVTVDGD